MISGKFFAICVVKRYLKSFVWDPFKRSSITSSIRARRLSSGYSRVKTGFPFHQIHQNPFNIFNHAIGYHRKTKRLFFYSFLKYTFIYSYTFFLSLLIFNQPLSNCSPTLNTINNIRRIFFFNSLCHCFCTVHKTIEHF